MKKLYKSKNVGVDNRFRCKYFPQLVKGFAALTIGLASCSDFFEKPIAGHVPELLSPGENAETDHYSQTFRWNPLPYALQYRLQVASPSFDSVRFYYADTTVTTPHVQLTLAPGKYEWRMKAINGSSETEYVKRSLRIHESELNYQTVLQLSPKDGYFTNSFRQEFNWQGIYSANFYRIQLDTVSFSDDAMPLIDRVTQTTSISIHLTGENRYYWRVRAERDATQSRWSEVRTFVFDVSPPSAPIPSTPLDKASVARPVRLTWSESDDAGSYRVYVYNRDSTLYSERFPVRVQQPFYILEEGNGKEELLWRVSAIDEAGNEGGLSPWRSFTIKN